MELHERLQKAREHAGFGDATEAAAALGVPYPTYAGHENGSSGFRAKSGELYARRYKVSFEWLMTGRGEMLPTAKKEIPIMGYLGAGAEVEPDFEQVPPEGLDDVTLPFPVPEDMIAFKVRGTSMLPVFRPDTTIVVYKEQKKPIESFLGYEVAVRLEDGRRFIKTLERGDGGYYLRSWNDMEPIGPAAIAWVGEIFAVLPATAVRKVERQGGLQGRLQLKTGTGG